MQMVKNLQNFSLSFSSNSSCNSFSAINVTERTASVGKDVSRQFAKQVQFNPGKTKVKTPHPTFDVSNLCPAERLNITLLDEFHFTV